MGYEYFKRPLQSVNSTSDLRGGVDISDGTLSLSHSTATAVAAAATLNSSVGVHFLTEGTSGSAKDFLLEAPNAIGSVKLIFLSKNTSSEELQIHTQSTAVTFFGTTFNTITVAASTVNPAGTPALILVGASATEWAVTCGSTINWDFSASTGSTAQA